MPKKGFILFLLIFLLKREAGITQNLVPNNSFEDYYDCQPMITNTSPWYSPTMANPDYMNACAEQGNYSVPLNNYGFQYAHSGVAYAYIGISVYYLYREYISVPLIDSLRENVRYCVRFYVSSDNLSEWFIDALGAYFSKGPIDTTGQPNEGMYLVNFSPQINNPPGKILDDTLNWIVIEGSFIANGGENNMTIGCFTPNDRILKKRNSLETDQYAGYYIDDVSVTECPPDTVDTIPATLTVPNSFTPNYDGYNDRFVIENSKSMQVTLTVYNRWGKKIYENLNYKNDWDGAGAPEGVYYYILKAKSPEGGRFEKSGSIQLLR